MKTPEKWDVANFFVHNTQDYEVEPPDHIWNNIEQNLNAQASMPHKVYKFFKQNSLFLTTFSITVIVGITLLFYVFQSSKQEAVKQDAAALQPKTELNNNNANTTSQENKEVAAEISESNKAQSEIAVTAEKNVKENKTNSPVNELQSSEVIASAGLTEKTTDSHSDKATTEPKVSEVAVANNSAKTVSDKPKIWNLNLNSYKKVSRIIVTDMTGKEILSEKPAKRSPGMYPLDITRLTKGSYIVKVENDGKVMDVTTIKVD